MTVAELIRGAFRTLGVLATEETPKASEQADALETLNDMLDSWAGERLALWGTARGNNILTPGLNPHSFGSGGDFPFRPVRIDRASIVPQGSAGAEYPLRMLSDAEYQALQGKTATGMPTSVWVQSDTPTSFLYLNPVPNAPDNLILYTWQQIVGLSELTDDLELPPGYQRAIRYNLAKEMAPEYGVSLSAEAVAIAEESKSNLKRLNERESYLRCDPAVLQGGPFNLVSGGW